MGNLQKSQKETLTHTLQKYLENILHNAPVTVSEHLELNYQKAIIELFKDSRMSDVDVYGYDAPQSVYIDIIMKGDAVKLNAIAKSLSYETCSQAPMIRHLLLCGRLKEKNVIVLFTALINQLSNYFEKATSKSIEELAWMLLDDYGHLSIEDFIHFVYLCKRGLFTTEYQHVSSRGVNAEYLLDWLKKYIENREGKIQAVLHEFRNQAFGMPIKLDDLGRIMIEEYQKERAGKILQKDKISKLRHEHELRIKRKSCKQKLIDFIAEEGLYFKDNFCLLSINKRMGLAKTMVSDLFGQWRKEFEEYFTTEATEKVNEQGKKEVTADSFVERADPNGEKYIERIPALTLEKYLSGKIKQYIWEEKKRIGKLSPINLFREGLYNYAKNRKIENGNELWLLLDKKYKVTVFERIDKTVYSIASYLNKKLRDSYPKYVDEKLGKGELPLEKDDYLRKRAHHWVVDNCTVETNKPIFPNE